MQNHNLFLDQFNQKYEVFKKRGWYRLPTLCSIQRKYTIACVLMSSNWIGLRAVTSPYRVYWPPYPTKPLLMAHYIRLWYHRSVDGTAQRLFAPYSEAMPSYVSWWAPIWRATELSHHHNEYIEHHIQLNHCSWPITFGYGIIEACITRYYDSLYPTIEICHRTCPDGAQWRLPTAHQIAISGICRTIDA